MPATKPHALTFVPGLLLVVVVAFVLDPVVAPIPPCSPFKWINKVVESEELAWLLHDFPSHPVPPCRYEHDHEAPLEEQSLLAYFLKDTTRIEDELRSESNFWSQKGLSRLNRRFWEHYDGNGYTFLSLGKDNEKKYNEVDLYGDADEL